jgi:hypothetical protein
MEKIVEEENPSLHLLSIPKIEIKHKFKVDNLFYTFNGLNARISRQNFLIYVFS